MSTNATLSDVQWRKILAFLRVHPRTYAGKEASCRLFVEAVLWIPVPALNSVSCPINMGVGTACISDLPTGVTTVSGKQCICILLMTQTWKT